MTEGIRAGLAPALARHPDIEVGPRAASTHAEILRRDVRAVIDAVRGLTAPPARAAA
ncbi:hypothetical protein ACFV0O_22770 [Kitasatospora sp. NPDC059577]|uniref:hypothetical protein n=1 Tax=unclassified Kitasatospora TaxID=2633591 RepID=UPI00369763D1